MSHVVGRDLGATERLVSAAAGGPVEGVAAVNPPWGADVWRGRGLGGHCWALGSQNLRPRHFAL